MICGYRYMFWWITFTCMVFLFQLIHKIWAAISEQYQDFILLNLYLNLYPKHWLFPCCPVIMLIFLAFVFLLTPFPTHQASVGERKNSTKTAPHTITTLNIKQKQPALSSASKISNVSQNLVSSTMPPETPSVKKPSKNKPPSSSPIKVVIAEGCIQKEHQKDTINSSKAQETELSLKPGSPLVMTHHINLVPGSCTGGCETEMATLKDRVEILEKEMSALKKKCKMFKIHLCHLNALWMLCHLIIDLFGIF